MNEVIKAYTIVNTVDADGFDIEQKIEHELFADPRSVSYIDAYNSMQSAIKPTIAFEMRREDFDACRHTADEKHYYPSEVVWDGARYKLVRWYYKDGSKAVMVCG